MNHQRAGGAANENQRHVLSLRDTLRSGAYNIFRKNPQLLQKNSSTSTNKDILPSSTTSRIPLAFVNENTRSKSSSSVKSPPEKTTESLPSTQIKDEKQPIFNLYEDSTLAALPTGVTDIDAKYHERDIVGMDSISDNFFYMQYLESLSPISPEFLFTTMTDVDGNVSSSHGHATRSTKLVDERMRVILIDWIMNCHSKLQLRKETLYLGVQIFDRFIDICNSPKMRQKYAASMENDASVDKAMASQLKPIYANKSNLQLIGIASFVLATKYEEVTFPVLEDWVFLSADSIQRNEIIEMERRILKTLEFNLSMPNAIDFLRRGSKIVGVDQKTHYLAQFMLETALYNPKLASSVESAKASAALYIALRLLVKDRKIKSVWNKDLQFFMQITEKELEPLVQKICSTVIKTITDVLTKPKPKASAVYKKYSKVENKCIAQDAIIVEKTKGANVKFNPLIQNFADNKFNY